MLQIGTEWMIEAVGCNPLALQSVDSLAALFSRIVRELDLRPVSEAQWHVFPSPGGVTGFVMLSESHLACHTYPEHGVITINLYCCRTRPEWPWSERLAEMLDSADVNVRSFMRSVELPAAVAR